MIFEDPLNFFTFSIALVGNPLVPSSRFDPLFPFALGVVVLALFLILIYRSIGFSKLLQIIMINQNPFLTGFVFVLIVTSFRSSNEPFSLDSAAPRYIFGTIFLLVGVIAIVAENYPFVQKRVDKCIVLVFLVVMSFSVAGSKTGYEWIVTRSLQSEKVVDCILRAQETMSQCLSVSSMIREANSSNEELEMDLDRLNEYFKN
jgi:glucan phosphoethanolaminetransferase (alkaline phosphatase superfamily)